MSEADSGDLSPSLVEGEVDFPFSRCLNPLVVVDETKHQVSHHTRPDECEVDSDPPPPHNRSTNSALDNCEEQGNLASPVVADVNNSTLNTSEEIGTTADLEDCDVHSEQGSGF